MSIRYRSSQKRDKMFHAGIELMPNGFPTFSNPLGVNRRIRKIWQRMVTCWYNKANNRNKARM